MDNYDAYAVYSVIGFVTLYLAYLWPIRPTYSYVTSFKLVRRAEWRAMQIEIERLRVRNDQLLSNLILKSEGKHGQMKFDPVVEQPKEIRIPMVINGIKQVHVWNINDWEQRKKDKVYVRRNGKRMWVDDYEKGDEYWVENNGRTFWTKTLQAGDKITYPYRVEWDKPKTNGHKSNGNGNGNKYVNPRRLADKAKVVSR